MYIEKQTDSPLLIYLVVPASECLILSLNYDKLEEFYSKLVSLFSKKLCTSKCELDVSTELMCVVLKREFHLAVSAPSLVLAKLLTSGVGIILKAMRRSDILAECSVELTDIVAECLNYFAEKKHGYQWNLPFLKLIEFAPLITCNLIPTLMQAINTNSYKFQTRKCEDILQCILLSSNSTPFLHILLLHNSIHSTQLNYQLLSDYASSSITSSSALS
ncbi:hypothetical protein LOD99_9845 [Oopsacas minuta]|uniref:Uncharacterized protein n=1 Tax=Oopsacas minuta TaxID=111878 RepID=A0AAV7KLW6_9METZ|nr:hypothetical protein LOD99_9845 [Oopsacas minuta]